MNIRIPIRVFIDTIKDRGWGLVVLYPLSHTTITQRFNERNKPENIEKVIIYSLNKKIQNSIKAIQINFVEEELSLNTKEIERELSHLEISWNLIYPDSKQSHKSFEIIQNKIRFITQTA